MKGLTKLVVLFILVYISNFDAMAQYDPGATLSLGIGHGQNALSQSVMRNAFNSNGKFVVKANNADYIYLGASHYSSFEEKIMKQLVANNQNVDKGKLRSFLVSARTMHHFGTKARANGLKDTYIADILATGVAWNWEMYHQTSATKEKVVSLRNSILKNMHSNGIKNQVAKLSEEDKRDWILSFMYNNSMLAQQIKNSRKISAQHKQQLVQTAKQAGVPDIARVSLK